MQDDMSLLEKMDFEKAIQSAQSQCTDSRPVYVRIGQAVYRVWPDGIYIKTDVFPEIMEDGQVLQSKILRG